MTAPVRFAILGFGHHAVRRLLPAFARSEKTRLVGMWRRDQSAAKQNCAEHHIAHCFTTAEELCSSPDVDAVFITSPDAMHRADTLLAVKIRARRGSYPVAAGDEPIRATVVVGNGATGNCGDTRFDPADCDFSTAGNRLTCRR